MTGCASTSGRHDRATDYTNHGCRCPLARAAHGRYRNEVRLDHLHGQRRTVEATATRRRLEALSAIGWSDIAIARELDVSKDVIYLLRTRERVYRSSADRIAELYQRINNVPGGNDRARRRAERQGWLQPGWWDDDTIGDPDFDPIQFYKDTESSSAARRTTEVQTVADLSAKGLSAAQIADRLNCSSRRVVRLRAVLRADASDSASNVDDMQQVAS